MELLLAGVLVAYQVRQGWKATEMDEKALAKNSKAFGKAAEAASKVKLHEEALFETMKINAIRKDAILRNHISRFLELYSVIDDYQLKIGAGIKEMENIQDVQNHLLKRLEMPKVAAGLERTDMQLITQYAIHGLGGLMLKDSENNMKLASRNMANANVVVAQADNICIVYDGLKARIQICSELLQKLSAVDVMALREISRILEKNGASEELYTDQDIESINLCAQINIALYHLINTPLIDENNQFEKAAETAISDGQKLINMLG